jgi:hypothetical protein
VKEEPKNSKIICLKQQVLIEQREAIQDDLCSILDGLDDEFITRVCEAVVERFAILLHSAEELPRTELGGKILTTG